MDMEEFSTSICSEIKPTPCLKDSVPQMTGFDMQWLEIKWAFYCSQNNSLCSSELKSRKGRMFSKDGILNQKKAQNRVLRRSTLSFPHGHSSSHHQPFPVPLGTTWQTSGNAMWLHLSFILSVSTLIATPASSFLSVSLCLARFPFAVYSDCLACGMKN